ncbi:MAG: AAA family ATPase, partial [Actinomycetota bacterium]|nr:AAA family ATPase [Actinomycetota bacterium]
MSASATTLIGRDSELKLLQDCLEAATGGSSQVIVFTGEAGIGKSSLLSELVRSADALGYLTLPGRAAEFERELPFGVVIDSFEEYLQSLDRGLLASLEGCDLGALGAVFPSLRELGSGSDHPTSAGERFRVHRAMRELVDRLAMRQPLVLAVDDVHWADRASLELVEHLLRRPPDAPVVLAVAYRTGQADPRLVGAIEAAARERPIEHIELGPLTIAEVESLLGADTTPGERRRVHQDSGGNPFYALELARSGSAGARVINDLGTASNVPAAVATAITSELDRFSESGQIVAQSAAVTGDPFELDLAIEASGVTQEEGLSALDELTAGDLVRATDVPRRFRFRHPLVRRAIYEAIAQGSRLVLHERCAQALAARGAAPAERAHHVEQAARRGDQDAVTVLRAAGEEAQTNAPASAQRWLEAVLRLLPEATPPEERVGLLVALAEAQAATGQFEQSRASILECIALADTGADVGEVGLIGACAGIEQLLGRHEEARTRLTSALAQLPGTV